MAVGPAAEVVSVAEVRPVVGNKNWPWPLTKKDAEHLANVIREIEQKTSGEIRLMMVRSSLMSGRVKSILFGLFMTMGLSFFWLERNNFIGLSMWWVLPVLILVAGTLAFLLAPWPFIRRAVTPVYDLRSETLRRAELEFYREGLNLTTSRTGILLFVSLVERQAVVLADQGIAAKIPGDHWAGVVEQLIEGARLERPEPFQAALQLCGEVLRAHFPSAGPAKNELPNHLIFKD